MHNELRREEKFCYFVKFVPACKGFIGTLLLECNKPDVVNKLSGDILIVSCQIQYYSLFFFKDMLILRNLIFFFTSELNN